LLNCPGNHLCSGMLPTCLGPLSRCMGVKATRVVAHWEAEFVGTRTTSKSIGSYGNTTDRSPDATGISRRPGSKPTRQQTDSSLQRRRPDSNCCLGLHWRSCGHGAAKGRSRLCPALSTRPTGCPIGRRLGFNRRVAHWRRCELCLRDRAKTRRATLVNHPIIIH
jgi:hypothetical protein